MNKNDFILELIKDLSEIALVKKYIITQVANDELKLMIVNGINSLSDEEFNSPAVKIQVKQNVQLFLGAMCTDSKRRFMSKHLEYRSFVNARKSIISLWPFY